MKNEPSTPIRDYEHETATLKHLEQAESLSRFASSIAHEVNNPLSQIVLAADYLANPRPLSDKMRETIVSYIRDGASRIEKTMNGMIRTCSPIEMGMAPADANQLIDEALGQFEARLQAEKNIVIEKHFAPVLPAILADKRFIVEALVHLCANAFDAMAQGGTLTLTTTPKSFVVSEREGWQRQAWFRAGDEAVIIELADTGHGIAEKDMGFIYEPFFTTRPSGKGAGLGLTVTRKIVELHNGRIEIKNRPEGGVCVAITLKAAAKP